MNSHVWWLVIGGHIKVPFRILLAARPIPKALTKGARGGFKKDEPCTLVNLVCREELSASSTSWQEVATAVPPEWKILLPKCTGQLISS